MKRNDDSTSEIRQALERESERRFDGERLGRALAARGRVTAWSANQEARAARRGPFGSLPVAVQWTGLAAALLGAALGVRSLYLEQTHVQALSREPAVTFPDSKLPPGAGATTSTPSVAPAPTLHESDSPAHSPEAQPRPRRSDRRHGDLIAETGSTPDPLGAPEPAPAPDGAATEPAASGATVARAAKPVAVPRVAEPDASDAPEPVAGAFSGISAVGVRAAEKPAGGVRVLSVRAGGHAVRPEVREATEVGATFVIVPAVAAFSALRDAPLRNERWGGRIANAAFFANGAPNGKVFGPKDEALPSDDPGDPPASPSGGAYYVRLFLGSGFEPALQRSQGLMGDGLQVVPLRENEVWGDEAQEQFLAKSFRLTSISAVDGARVEPDETDHMAESSFVAGIGGQLLGVSLEASPGDVEGEHRIELRLHRADGRPGDPAEGAIILAATLMVENGRIVVLGIPEPDSAVHGGRGPRIAFLAISPRFGAFEPSQAAEDVQLVEGDVEPPVLVEKTQPVYTPEALEQHAEGKVVLRAVIRKDGQVNGVQILRVPQVPGGEYLMEAAARAVREWRYLPARLDGEPVNVYFTVVVNFSLNRGNGT